MARSYRLTLPRRVINLVAAPLARRGWGGKHVYLLTVRGRKTGTPYSTPVLLVEDERGRFLVAPYGETGWVKNARAAGRVELTHGRTESARIEELGPEEAAPILRDYLSKARVTRPFFDARPDSPLEAFAAEAHRHPVFRLAAGDDTAAGAAPVT